MSEPMTEEQFQALRTTQVGWLESPNEDHRLGAGMLRKALDEIERLKAENEAMRFDYDIAQAGRRRRQREMPHLNPALPCVQCGHPVVVRGGICEICSARETIRTEAGV